MSESAPTTVPAQQHSKPSMHASNSTLPSAMMVRQAPTFQHASGNLYIRQATSPDVLPHPKISSFDEPSSAVLPGNREHNLLTQRTLQAHEPALITPVKRQRDAKMAASPASPTTTILSQSYAAPGGGQSNAKRAKTIKFHDRFKGKIQMMNKEGHIGVVKSTGKPIEKVALGDQLQRQNSNFSIGSSPGSIQQRLTNMLHNADSQSRQNLVSSFNQTTQSNIPQQPTNNRLHDTASRESRLQNQPLRYLNSGPSQGQGQVLLQQPAQAITLGPLRDVLPVHNNEQSFQAFNLQRPSNAPANQFSQDPAMTGSPMQASIDQNSGSFQRGQPLLPMHMLNNYSQRGFDRKSTMHQMSSLDSFHGRMILQQQSNRIVQVGTAQAYHPQSRQSTNSNYLGLAQHAQSGYKVVMSASQDGQLVDSFEGSDAPTRIHSFRQGSPVISTRQDAMASTFDQEQPFMMSGQRYTKVHPRHSPPGAGGPYVGAPAVPHRIVPPTSAYQNMKGNESYSAIQSAFQSGFTNNPYPQSSSQRSFRELPHTEPASMSHEQDHGSLEIQKVMPAHHQLRNSTVLPSAASGTNSLTKRKSSLVNRSHAQVTFARDLSVDSMPNPLDFHASYQKKRVIGESLSKQAGLHKLPNKLDGSNSTVALSLRNSGSHENSQTRNGHSLPTISHPSSLTEQEKNVAKLKERLQSKKLTSLKSSSRRQRGVDLPSKTVTLNEPDSDTKDSHFQHQLSGLASEKTLKIDSGLVQLKNHEHRFNKRSSVNFPINSMKVIPTSDKHQFVSSVDTIESDVHRTLEIPVSRTQPTTSVATGAANSVVSSSTSKHQGNAERMPISARVHKAKTQGSVIDKDKSMTFNDDGINNFKQTAQFGSMQLGGTESPRQRGTQLEAAIQEANYGHVLPKTEKKRSDKGVSSGRFGRDKDSVLPSRFTRDPAQRENDFKVIESFSHRKKSSIVGKDDVQRWRSDRFDSSLHQRLLKQKDFEKKHRLKFTEKLLTGRAQNQAKTIGQNKQDYMYINQQPSLQPSQSSSAQGRHDSTRQLGLAESTDSNPSFYK